MRILIVYAHPDNGKSHNSMVFREVVSELESRKIGHSIADLYRDRFDPSLPAEEWAEDKCGADVKRYQKMISESDRLIFIYPVWWYSSPAILKGFFDRVFTSGFAYNFRKEPLWMKVAKSLFMPLLSIRLLYPVIQFFLPVDQHLRGKKALVINTYGGDESGFRVYGHAPQYTADRAVLEFCGISPVYRVNWYNTRHKKEIPEATRRAILSGLRKLLE
ncbi:MAG TPA: NAD(P)H-dependent oxidoreductase [Candidatus Bilamarchaeum sp.]|nr:NAD(P)H-dependent oxidoreductase [Candidatus Bilamarchaeum sp.]